MRAVKSIKNMMHILLSAVMFSLILIVDLIDAIWILTWNIIRFIPNILMQQTLNAIDIIQNYFKPKSINLDPYSFDIYQSSYEFRIPNSPPPLTSILNALYNGACRYSLIPRVIFNVVGKALNWKYSITDRLPWLKNIRPPVLVVGIDLDEDDPDVMQGLELTSINTDSISKPQELRFFTPSPDSTASLVSFTNDDDDDDAKDDINTAEIANARSTTRCIT